MGWRSGLLRNGEATATYDDLNPSSKNSKTVNEFDQSVIDCMKDEWKLYQDRYLFTWYLKKKGELPFGVVKANLNKRTAERLIEMKVIKHVETTVHGEDRQFVLTDAYK